MKLLTVFFALSTLLVVMTGCPRDYKQAVRISNNSKSDISVYIGVASYRYPDTVFPSERLGIQIRGKETTTYIYNNDYSDSSKDTLSFFIWDTEILNSQPWDTIRNHYKILRRYDLSHKDLLKLNWHISYPPSSDMRNIKMYPAYEE